LVNIDNIINYAVPELSKALQQKEVIIIDEVAGMQLLCK
jgi:nucleoside-triphosphatase THEP1